MSHAECILPVCLFDKLVTSMLINCRKKSAQWFQFRKEIIVVSIKIVPSFYKATVFVIL